MAQKRYTHFSRFVPSSRRAKHAGYYCDVSRWRRKGTHTFLDSFPLAVADALSMLDTIVTFQDGAEKVLTLFSIRSA